MLFDPAGGVILPYRVSSHRDNLWVVSGPLGRRERGQDCVPIMPTLHAVTDSWCPSCCLQWGKGQIFNFHVRWAVCLASWFCSDLAHSKQW